MPPMETADRRQKAVLWPLVGRDRYNEPLRGEAVELDVRWVAKRHEGVGPDGTPIALDGIVVTDREVAIGSQMWQGELADWLGTGSTTTDEDLFEVISYNRTVDIRNRDVRYTLGIKKFRSALPEEG